MNLTMWIARSAGLVCARFTALLQSVLRAADSILQILRNKTRLLTCGFTNVFDSYGTLRARALQGLRASLKGVACSVALAIGISLCLPMSHASSGSIDAINPKTYIRLSMDHKEALCLIKLYGKESAFNSKAIGNIHSKHKTYGIPQIKNPLIYTKSPIEQVQYGIKYIDHRYHGSTCSALLHFNRLGWH